MEGGHKCWICSRCFRNAKALESHMNSHLAFHPLPSKPETHCDSNAQGNPSQLSSYRGKKGSRSINNLDKSSHQPLVDEVYSSLNSDSDIFPTKISSENSSQFKLKEIQRLEVPAIHASLKKSIDTISITSSTEDVALALLSLSKGERIQHKGQVEKGKSQVEEYKGRSSDEEEESGCNGYDDDNSDGDNNNDDARAAENEVHQCKSYEEVFQSHQTQEQPKEQCIQIHAQCDATNAKEVITGNKRGRKKYPCPSCSKVFKSGRALGGHKKVHTSSSIPPDPIKDKEELLDLNLPPPDDDDINYLQH